MSYVSMFHTPLRRSYNGGGCASHDGSGGMLVIYTNKDLKRIKAEDQKLDTYVPSKEHWHTLMAKQIECHNKVQGKTAKGIMDFFNPCNDECPQVIVCHYFGDKLNR